MLAFGWAVHLLMVRVCSDADVVNLMTGTLCVHVEGPCELAVQHMDFNQSVCYGDGPCELNIQHADYISLQTSSVCVW